MYTVCTHTHTHFTHTGSEYCAYDYESLTGVVDDRTGGGGDGGRGVNRAGKTERYFLSSPGTRLYLLTRRGNTNGCVTRKHLNDTVSVKRTNVDTCNRYGYQVGFKWG